MKWKKKECLVKRDRYIVKEKGWLLFVWFNVVPCKKANDGVKIWCENMKFCFPRRKKKKKKRKLEE